MNNPVLIAILTLKFILKTSVRVWKAILRNWMQTNGSRCNRLMIGGPSCSTAEKLSAALKPQSPTTLEIMRTVFKNQVIFLILVNGLLNQF